MQRRNLRRELRRWHREPGCQVKKTNAEACSASAFLYCDTPNNELYKWNPPPQISTSPVT